MEASAFSDHVDLRFFFRPWDALDGPLPFFPVLVPLDRT